MTVQRIFLPRAIRTLPLVAIIFFSSSGGPYGIETVLSSSGVGMSLILLITIPLLLSLPMSLMNAELSSAIPLEGGFYSWVKIACGPFLGFMEAAFSWMASWLDTALYPIIFVDYLSIWFPGVARGKHVLFSFFGGNFSIDSHWLMAVAIMIPLAIINIRGVKLVGRGLIISMALLFAPLLVFIGLAVSHFAANPTTAIFSPMTLHGQSFMSSAGAGLGIMLWSYIGYDSATTASGEIENASAAYPRALLYNLPLVVLSYTLPVLAALASGLHSGDVGKWDNGDLAHAANLLGGTWLQNSLIIGALVAQAGLFSSFLLCMSRLPFMLAADGYLPRSMARISSKTNTPVRAIVISVCIYAFFASLNFTTLIDSDMFLTLCALLLEFAALLVLRFKFPNMKRPYKIPGGWWGAIGVCISPTLLTLWLMQNTFVSEPLAFWLGVGLSSTAAVSYFLLKKYVKKDQPDAELDISGIDFGEARL
jgi:hypothetical protein